MNAPLAKLALLGLVVALTISGVWLGKTTHAYAPPPLPTVAATATPGVPSFSELMIVLINITVIDGSELPDGLPVFARIGDEYETEPVLTENGTAFLKIIPNFSNAKGRSVDIYIDTVRIVQDMVYAPGVIDLTRPVTIPNLPLPTPTPTPTSTSVKPAVYSGTVTIAGAKVQDGMVLVARIGAYESSPANLEGPNFTGLVIITSNEALVGQPVEFYLNGVAATHSPGPFVPGKTQRLDLVFIGVPTPEPTAAPVVPTAAPVVPTAAPVVPTATPLPPASAPLPPASAATPRIVTATPTDVPPTATSVPPTNTPIVLLATATASTADLLVNEDQIVDSAGGEKTRNFVVIGLVLGAVAVAVVVGLALYQRAAKRRAS
jgi:hypothetical protein